MSRLEIPFFDYRRQLKKIKPEIKQAIERVLNSGYLVLGQEVINLESSFSKFIGVKYGIGVNSGTDALKIAARALGLKVGDEIITVSNTATPTISAMRELGLIIKFIDIKEDFNIDETKIAAAITKKTKAIIPVHLFGQPAEMSVIIKIAKRYKLKVIEDCCQAHGAKINGRRVGTFGDLACFSFYPTKNLGAYGDGGIILTDNKKLADVCRALRMYGMKRSYYSKKEGYNSRLDEMQAAILNVKIKYLEQWNQRRKASAEYYINNIKNPKIILPKISHGLSHSWHLFVIRTENRSRLEKYLKACKIGYGIHYPYPIHFQPAYEFLGYKPASLPQTEKFAKQILSLPIFPELTQRELIYIVDKINLFK